MRLKRSVRAFSGCLATAALATSMSTARAGAVLTVCNRGTANVDVAEIDWYGYIDPNPRISGWLRLAPHECYQKKGTEVDVSLAFASEGASKYYLFDVPEIRPEPFSNRNYATKVELTQRTACVQEADFDRTVAKSELDSCPAGWRHLRFNWHVQVSPSQPQDYESLNLTIEPKATEVSTQSEPAPQAVPAASAPSVSPAQDKCPPGTLFGRLPLATKEQPNEALSVYKVPGGSWRAVASDVPIMEKMVPVITTRPLPTDNGSTAAFAIVTFGLNCVPQKKVSFITKTELRTALNDSDETEEAVSLQNLDFARMRTVSKGNCDEYILPCRNGTPCVFVGKRGYRLSFTTEVTISHVTGGLRHPKTQVIQKALHTLIDGTPMN